MAHNFLGIDGSPFVYHHTATGGGRYNHQQTISSNSLGQHIPGCSSSTSPAVAHLSQPSRYKLNSC